MTTARERIEELELVVRAAHTTPAEREEALRTIAELNEQLIAEAEPQCVRRDGRSVVRVTMLGRPVELCHFHYHAARAVRPRLEVVLERDPEVMMWVAAADVAIQLARQ